jgi:hypothetical protein
MLWQGVHMNLDQQRLCIELQHLDWARQLNEEVIQDIATSATLMDFQAGRPGASKVICCHLGSFDAFQEADIGCSGPQILDHGLR